MLHSSQKYVQNVTCATIERQSNETFSYQEWCFVIFIFSYQAISPVNTTPATAHNV